MNSKIKASAHLGNDSNLTNPSQGTFKFILKKKNSKNYGTKDQICEPSRRDTSRGKWVYDKGRSWVALLTCFYIQCFVCYLTPCFGIFFSQKLRTFAHASEIRTTILPLHILLWDVGSLLSAVIVSNFGHRGTSFIALVATLISFSSLAFVNGPEILFFAFGILLAVSGGFLWNLTVIILPLYFEKYRRPAFCFVTVGMSCSGIIMPRLIRYLNDFYGYSGALLLYGACLFQGAAFVALFEPHRMFSVETTVSQSHLISGDELSKRNEFPHEEDRSACCCNNKASMKLRAWFRSCWYAMKNERVLIMALARSFFLSSHINFSALLPFFLEYHGHSPQFSAACISNSSVTNLISRIFITFTVGHRWLHRKFFLVSGALIAFGSNVGFIVALEHEDFLTGISFLYGIGVGTFLSIFYAILVDVVGLEMYTESSALSALCLTILESMFSLYLGLLRDFTGSYIPAVGSCALLNFGLASMLVVLFYRMKHSRV